LLTNSSPEIQRKEIEGGERCRKRKWDNDDPEATENGGKESRKRKLDNYDPDAAYEFLYMEPV